jgi:hypothetical protein
VRIDVLMLVFVIVLVVAFAAVVLNPSLLGLVGL